MSTLAMALAAVMAAGSAPETVSAEVEQRLNLHGVWEGTWTCGRNVLSAQLSASATKSGKAVLYLNRWKEECLARGLTTTGGRLRCDSAFFEKHWVGRYKACGDCIFLWFCEARGPDARNASNRQWLLILRRVESCK